MGQRDVKKEIIQCNLHLIKKEQVSELDCFNNSDQFVTEAANTDQINAFFYSKSNHFQGSYCCDVIIVDNCQPVGSTGNQQALITLQDLFIKSRKKAINVFIFSGRLYCLWSPIICVCHNDLQIKILIMSMKHKPSF